MHSSLKEAVKEQGLVKTMAALKEIMPDITDQYTTFKLDSEYLKTKARALHAFQVSLAGSVIEKFEKPVIVDIGDSAGTHLKYVMGLYAKGRDIKCLSVNLDPMAVEKIKKKGLDAINVRAENLKDHDIKADIFFCFETLEHLMDPCRFLHELSSKTDAEYLIVTVPYVKTSRVGLNHIRMGFKENRYAENTHIFELNPDDWKLIARHAGWSVAEEKIYLQYSKKGLSLITKPLWRKFDFEGFYGMILMRDASYASKYMDW